MLPGCAAALRWGCGIGVCIVGITGIVGTLIAGVVVFPVHDFLLQV